MRNGLRDSQGTDVSAIALSRRLAGCWSCWSHHGRLNPKRRTVTRPKEDPKNFKVQGVTFGTSRLPLRADTMSAMDIDEQIFNLIIGAETMALYIGLLIAAFIAWLRQIKPEAQDGDEAGLLRDESDRAA